MRIYFLCTVPGSFSSFSAARASALRTICTTYKLPYALTLDRVSLPHVQTALFILSVLSSIRAFTVSAYRLLHAIAIMSNPSLVTASSCPPVLWLASYPVRFVIFRSLKPQVLHRFVHRFPETRLYLSTSEKVRLVLRVVAPVRLASRVRKP